MAIPPINDDPVTSESIKENRQKLQKSLREGQNRIVQSVNEVAHIQTEQLRLVQAEMDAAKARAGAELEAAREAKRAADQEEADAVAGKDKKSGGGGKVKLGKGGMFAKLGKALGGAVGGALGGLLKGLAWGLSAFAAPKVAAGVAVFGLFMLAIGKAIDLVGTGVKKFGEGLTGISVGMENLDKVAKKIDPKNLEKAGKSLAAFLEPLGMKSILGGIIVFLTGNLPSLAGAIEKLSTIKVDKANLQAAGDGMKAFLDKMGGGSFWSSIKGGLASKMVGDMDNISKAVETLDATGKKIVVADVQKVADSMEALHQPLADFSKGGIVANFVGSNALTDIAKGVNALANVKITDGNAVEVAAAMEALAGPLFKFSGASFIANFVGGDVGKNIAKQIEALLATDTKNIENLSKVAKALDTLAVPLLKFGVGGSLASFVGEKMGENVALQVENLLNMDTSNVDKIPVVTGALSALAPALIKFGTGGFFAKFVGEKMGENISKQVKDLLIMEADREKVDNVTYAMDKLGTSLAAFAGNKLIGGLADLGSKILGFLTGEKSPMEEIMKVGDNSEKLTQGADALERIAKAMQVFSKIKLARSQMDFSGLAENLGKSIPLMMMLSTGGTLKKGWFKSDISFGEKGSGGILNPDLKLEEVANKVALVREILTGIVSPRSLASGQMAAAGAGAGGGGGGTTVVNSPTVTNSQSNIAHSSRAMIGGPVAGNRNSWNARKQR